MKNGKIWQETRKENRKATLEGLPRGTGKEEMEGKLWKRTKLIVSVLTQFMEVRFKLSKISR